MIVRVCKSYHSEIVLPLVREAWQDGIPLIFCPPHLNDYAWMKYLPEGQVEWHGEAHGPSQIERVGGVEYPESPILGVFTSGTISGRPRLVLYSKRNIEASLAAIGSLFELSRIQTIFSYAQPFHTFGLLLGYVMSLRLGCGLVTPEGKYSRKSHAARLALDEKDLLTLGTPTHFHDLLESAGPAGLKPSYSCIVGGAGVSVGLWKQLRDCLHIEKPSIGYGCTEASPGIAHLPPGMAPLEDNEIGFPLSNLDARIGPTEVRLSGPSLCLGVVDELGADFSRERAIRDTIEVRADGRWVFCGRSDLIINRGGEKFSLERIESAIFSQLGLPALAVALEEPRLGQDLGLLIRSENSADPAINEKLRGLLLRDFGLRFEACQVRFVDDLPAHPSSKPDRREAKRQFFASHQAEAR